MYRNTLLLARSCDEAWCCMNLVTSNKLHRCCLRYRPSCKAANCDMTRIFNSAQVTMTGARCIADCTDGGLSSGTDWHHGACLCNGLLHRLRRLVLELRLEVVVCVHGEAAKHGAAACGAAGELKVVDATPASCPM